VSILHGPLGPGGTAGGKGIPGHDAWGKTGTNDRQISSAFIGGTTNLVSFVWHGVPEEDVPGAGFGADVPNTIWRYFMIPATQGVPDDAFPAPGPECDAPGKVIDPLLGRTIDIPKPPPPPPREEPAPEVPAPAPEAPAPAPAPAPPPAQAPASVPAPAGAPEG
jgi:membrane peptidoglycan carboxypeptidase